MITPPRPLPPSRNRQIVLLAEQIAQETIRAEGLHREYASPHEGYAVIMEELDELWEHVRADTGRSHEARKEAIQIAATALRYALCVCHGESK